MVAFCFCKMTKDVFGVAETVNSGTICRVVACIPSSWRESLSTFFPLVLMPMALFSEFNDKLIMDFRASKSFLHVLRELSNNSHWTWLTHWKHKFMVGEESCKERLKVVHGKLAIQSVRKFLELMNVATMSLFHLYDAYCLFCSSYRKRASKWMNSSD